MAGKTRKPAVAKEPDPAERGRVKHKAMVSMMPSVNAAAVMDSYSSNILGKPDFAELVDSLSDSIKTVQGGEMKPVEAMLMGQAQALQTMFVSFARRAQIQELQNNLESFFRMAMKAQNQCRMTLETLAAIKNPPVVFARQANIANGPQQVNNGVAPNPSHARQKKEIQSNGLLTDGVEHGPTLDARGTAAPSGTDPAMATLEQIDWPANG